MKFNEGLNNLQEIDKSKNALEFNPDKRLDSKEVEKDNIETKIKEYHPDDRVKPVSFLPTLNKSLENDCHPITGVPFERRRIHLDNDIVEAVVPRFESYFDAKIPKDTYKDNDVGQFKECNKQLAEKIDNDPEFKEQFSEEQIMQIKEGRGAPDGFVWHHDAEPGKMQLVDSKIHNMTGHTGGRTIWGGGSDFR